MRTMIALTPVLLASCMPAASVDDSSRAELPSLTLDSSEPRLALAEHLLAEYFASDIANQPTICLAVSDGRSEAALPPEQETELVVRFSRLAPFARCTWREGGWVDAESDEPALVFTIHSFSCASVTSCSGWASYTAGATAAPSALYRMTYEGGRWTFERDLRLIAE